jgi:glycosyltransferase involved in cell wall biosynthesis
VELGGDVALPLDDATPAGIAAALTRALADREGLARRGAAGRAEVERLSWPRAAAATLAVWAEAIGARR